jgi:transcriptional repressor NrdR
VKCPFCGELRDKVVDSRESREGDSIRRRRQCLTCKKRFTSYERVGEIPYMVIKKDGTRQQFERDKFLAGVLRAIEKTPVKATDVDAIADKAEQLLIDRPEREVPAKELGELIMTELQKVSQVAYVRFASVYREFREIDDFAAEVRRLKGHKE